MGLILNTVAESIRPIRSCPDARLEKAIISVFILILAVFSKLAVSKNNNKNVLAYCCGRS
jgi:hypothetical protein